MVTSTEIPYPDDTLSCILSSVSYNCSYEASQLVDILLKLNNSGLLNGNSGQSAAEDADDAIWILTSTFIIFTMQSGFGLLESGSVSTKNEANIMVKNVVDVVFGGLTYWLFGYALSFGEDERFTTGFNGWGNFLVFTPKKEMGKVYAKFFFQSSFATTATTIVSGAMAERTRLEAYIVFSLLNTLVYVFPAHWCWAPSGWLYKLGFVDIAGDGPVHLVGGATGLVATILLKPRYQRYEKSDPPPMGSPTNALLGTFMLWWGWLGFNCGSTFGVSGAKWKLAAKSAISTLTSSLAGGSMGCLIRSSITTLVASVAGGLYGVIMSYIFKKKMFDIGYIINSILGSLVGITGYCALAEPWESFVIGLVGSAVSLLGIHIIDRLRIDDPVGCVGVHGFGSMWGLLAVGLFFKKDPHNAAIGLSADTEGLIYGGGFYLLGIQMLGFVSIAGWSIATSFIILKGIDFFIPIRMPLMEEILGADTVEHGLGEQRFSKNNTSQKTNSENAPVSSIDTNTNCSEDLKNCEQFVHRGAFGAKLNTTSTDTRSMSVLANSLLASQNLLTFTAGDIPVINGRKRSHGTTRDSKLTNGNPKDRFRRLVKRASQSTLPAAKTTDDVRAASSPETSEICNGHSKKDSSSETNFDGIYTSMFSQPSDFTFTNDAYA